MQRVKQYFLLQFIYWRSRLTRFFQPVDVGPSFGAYAKSMALFLDNLTPAQRQCFLSNNHFCAFGSHTGNLYEIGNYLPFNVTDGLYDYCTYVPGVPLYDSLLAQKILIECNEKLFLRHAHKHRARWY